jgi:hypothetical protein
MSLIRPEDYPAGLAWTILRSYGRAGERRLAVPCLSYAREKQNNNLRRPGGDRQPRKRKAVETRPRSGQWSRRDKVDKPCKISSLNKLFGKP